MFPRAATESYSENNVLIKIPYVRHKVNNNFQKLASLDHIKYKKNAGAQKEGNHVEGKLQALV